MGTSLVPSVPQKPAKPPGEDLFGPVEGKTLSWEGVEALATGERAEMIALGIGGVFMGVALCWWLLASLLTTLPAWVKTVPGLALFIPAGICFLLWRRWRRRTLIKLRSERDEWLREQVEKLSTKWKAKKEQEEQAKTAEWDASDPFCRLIQPTVLCCFIDGYRQVRLDVQVANVFHMPRPLRLEQGSVFFIDRSIGAQAPIAVLSIPPWAVVVPERMPAYEVERQSAAAALSDAEAVAVRAAHKRGDLNVVADVKFSTILKVGTDSYPIEWQRSFSPNVIL